MKIEIVELVNKFPEWRAHFEKQRANGSPFCGYAPEISDIEQMMDIIETVIGEELWCNVQSVTSR